MPDTHWTAAHVRELIAENRPWPRYELLHGELLVTPPPRGPHQTAVAELHRLFDVYAYDGGIGLAMISPADLSLRPETIVQPDVFVIPRGSVRAAGRQPEWSDITSLLLAVEVLSASSLRTDRVIKRDFYLANGVDEYWIVDLDARLIERWLPSHETPELVRGTLVWSPRGAEPLRIDLPALFDRIDAKWRCIQES